MGQSPHRQIDIAVIGINAPLLQEHGINVSIFRSDEHLLTLPSAQEAGVGEGDGVFSLGFPMGLVGQERNFVIVRQGVIARISDAYARSSDEILLDMSIFPGNSGGPVVTRPEIVAIGGSKAFDRAMLLGRGVGLRTLPRCCYQCSNRTYADRVRGELGPCFGRTRRARGCRCRTRHGA